MHFFYLHSYTHYYLSKLSFFICLIVLHPTIAMPVSDSSVPRTPNVFDPALWIGQGKRYIVEELPDYVIDTKCELLDLPQDAKNCLPLNEMPISAFLNHRLPTKLSELITVCVEDCFSKDSPSTNIATLADRPIPSDETIQLLDKAMGQAWLDGNRSIIDWRGDERIDFWATTTLPTDPTFPPFHIFLCRYSSISAVPTMAH